MTDNPVDPVSPVKESSSAEVAALIARLAAAGRDSGFGVEEFGIAAEFPLIAMTRGSAGFRPRVYLSAGIHGDEPAPPRALLDLLEHGFFHDRCSWSLCPLLNPTGLAAGTRGNADGRDLNRDYRAPETAEIRAHTAWLNRQSQYDVTLCLHEDWESAGFYLYELNPDHRPSLSDPIVDAVRRICPIEQAGTIDGRAVHGGIIRPDGDPLKRERWPEAIYLHAHHTRQSYTLETPSAKPLELRVAAQMAAVTAAVDEIARISPP